MVLLHYESSASQSRLRRFAVLSLKATGLVVAIVLAILLGGKLIRNFALWSLARDVQAHRYSLTEETVYHFKDSTGAVDASNFRTLFGNSLPTPARPRLAQSPVVLLELLSALSGQPKGTFTGTFHHVCWVPEGTYIVALRLSSARTFDYAVIKVEPPGIPPQLMYSTFGGAQNFYVPWWSNIGEHDSDRLLEVSAPISMPNNPERFTLDYKTPSGQGRLIASLHLSEVEPFVKLSPLDGPLRSATSDINVNRFLLPKLIE